MSGLVNYSSEEDQDDYHYKKAGERERIHYRSDRNSGSTDKEAAKRKMKKNYRERSKSPSPNSDLGSADHHGGSVGGTVTMTPPRDREKNFDEGKNRRSKNTTNSGSSSNNNNYTSGSSSYNDEEKYHKSEKRSDRYRDSSRDRRDCKSDAKYTKDSRGSRDYKDERGHDNSHSSFDNRKYEDSKRHSKDYSREHHSNKRECTSDYYKDDKRSHNDDKKMSSSSSSKDRFSSSSKGRHYDERKPYDDRNNERRDERHRINNEDRRNSGGGRSGGSNRDESFDRRSNHYDDRREQQDRSSSNYRSNSNKYSDRRSEEERKTIHHSTVHNEDKVHDMLSQSNTANDIRSNDLKLKSLSDDVPPKKTLPTARNFEALLTLPLSETALKESSSKASSVPALTATNVASSADESSTGTVQLPNYYNPKVINATKYATQMQKRKLIWGSKKTEDVAAKWGHAQFSQDSDGKVASKFMRLMGIKNTAGGGGGEVNSDESAGTQPTTTTATTKSSNPDYKTREAMFSTMEHQYEVARQVTHTMRGVGLGFNSQRPF